MTDWPARVLLNVVYAFLAERAEAADRVSIPTYLAAGAEADDVYENTDRAALDDWLDAPMGREADEYAAFQKYLTA